MCTYIEMYLFHRVGFTQGFMLIDPGYFSVAKQAIWLWIQYSHLRIGDYGRSGVMQVSLPLIELAYSHNVLFRLFLGLMEINPVFLLISLCISLVLGIN
jgi:hypothetical protein